MKYILSFETSCDDTSVAILDENGNVVKNIISSQFSAHKPYGGVVPEIASREHLKNIVPLFEGIIEETEVDLKDICAVGSTRGPGLLGSVLVGFSFAKSLAYSLQVPYYGINHIEAHLYSPWIEKRDLPFPALVLVVSGGHSHIFLVKDFKNYYLVSATRDDAAGEAFDKVGKKLKIPYPQGPKVDKLARKGNPDKFHFPLPRMKKGRDFSFSGLKTAFLYRLKENNFSIDNFDEDNLPDWVYDILASFEKAVVKHLTNRVESATKRFNPESIAISGGVAANTLLREKIREIADKFNLSLSIPSSVYCTDNAAMVGFLTYLKWKGGLPSELNSDAFATAQWEKIGEVEGK